MNLLGHFEFGLNLKPFIYSSGHWYKGKDKLTLNYWILQWIQTYKWIIEKNAINNKNTFLILYEDLCNKENAYKELCKLVNVNNTESESLLTWQMINIRKISLKLIKNI